MQKLEVHIQLACSDARDFNRYQTFVLADLVDEYAQKNIGIRLHILRVAGAFVTPDVVMDIKRIIEEAQRNAEVDQIDYFVHIQSHGHLDADSNKEYISHIYEMNVVPNSPLNCGMLEATTVGIELEQLLISSKPTVKGSNGTFVVDDELGIRRLLKEVYSWDGHLAGDWIKGIDKLRTHPRLQRTVLEQAIRNDPTLSGLGVKITAGFHDYSIHGLIRLDGGEPEVPFWDSAMKRIRDLGEKNSSSWAIQAEKQKPFAGLISMSDPKPGTRAKATYFYMERHNMAEDDETLINTVFHITGSNFDLPASPFGPYVIGGFYYAVKQLQLREWMVVGNTHEQTQRMIRKLSNDPIIELIKNHFGVVWMPMVASDLWQ
jgi:hypothetical protein